jgi:hypothetical protein
MKNNVIVHLLYSCLISVVLITSLFMTSNSVSGIVHSKDLKIERHSNYYVVHINDRTLPLSKDTYHHLLKTNSTTFEYTYTYTVLHGKSGNLLKFHSSTDAES